MVQALNFINLSSQQAPNDVDWAGLVNSGVQGVLIRLGHGIIRDPCASGHIAKAKQYGLYWHGYHTYEGVVNEPQFTIKNATELGLSTSQYYFVDLTKSSDPFNDYYALHATWLSQGYSTGLLISSEDYLSKFTDSEATASGTLRWLISDTEPADYDIWQYSSEGTVGTSSVKVGFNFAKTDKLKYNLSTTLTGADISKDPYNPQAPVGGAYIGWGYDTTGLGGGKTIGYSTNGNNFYALIGPDGLIVRKSDGNRIYGAISDQIDSAISANVIPAKSAADSAVSAADAAVASAQVTSAAVSAIASATAEAKAGANDALSRAKSAWDVATGAKAAVTDFDPLLKQAQSDAKAAGSSAVALRADVDKVTLLVNDPKIGLNATYQTAAGNAITISNVKSDVYQLETTAHGLTSRVGNLESKTNTQETAIEQNKNAITLKADQVDVDKINGTVSRLQSSLTVQAEQIKEKVTSSQVTGMLAGYATQEYTQSLVTQKADEWNVNLTKLKNDTQTSLTNLAVGVEGVQAQVYNSDGSSKITQLSNVIQTKVGTDDFNNLKQAVGLQTLESADINNMKTTGHYFVHNLSNNPIGGWVYVDVTGDGSSRIRQDVYQDNGSEHKYRRWVDTKWTDWEEGATYSEINQLKDDINLRVTKGDLISQINLQAGTALIQSNKLVLDNKTTIITGEAFIPSAAIGSISADKVMLGSSSLYNSDGSLNLVNTKDGTTSKISVTQGSVNFDGVNKTASIIRFASDNNTNAFTVNPTGATVTPTLFFERFDQPVGHWLGFTRNSIQEEGVAFNTWDNDGERFAVACRARFEKNLRTLGTLSQGTWDGTTAKPEAGVLTIKGGNTIWSGSDFLAVGSNVTGTYTGVWAKAFVQQSTLSAKTNIETVDPKYALDLVNKTDIRSYQYKSDVAQGYNKRYTSLIIDDVNDVSKYYAPNEFTNEERTGRDDGSAVGYLFLAVKELTRRIKNLEEKLNE